MIKKESLFYFDCEWAPQTKTIEELEIYNPRLYKAFTYQCDKWNAIAAEEGKPTLLYSTYYKIKAHFYPELCQIICVSYGFFNQGIFVVKSIYGADEKALLTSVADLFNKVHEKGLTLCGAGIIRYDMPWLSKRMMANGIIPSKNINFYGKKPWEIIVYDILEVWGQGNKQESYTPLELICATLNIPSSKDDLNGSLVAEAFYNGEIERIKDYCEKDVFVEFKCAERLIELSL